MQLCYDWYYAHANYYNSGLRKSPTPPDTLTSNTLLKTINKQSNLTEIRNEVAGLESPIPDVLSQSCLNMVLAYTDKLYKQLGGADSDPSAFAHLAMRAMNRPVVDLNPEVFVSEVRNTITAKMLDTWLESSCLLARCYTFCRYSIYLA